MRPNYELSEEEIARRRRRRKRKRRKRRLRKIRGIILLTLTLILFITLVVGIICGVVKVFKHIFHLDQEVVEMTTEPDTSWLPNGYILDENGELVYLGAPPEDNRVNETSSYGTGDDAKPNSNYTDTHGNVVHAASKSPDYQAITSEDIKAPHAILMDAETSQVLAGRDYDSRIYPASMTKVMTLIVAVDYMNSIPETYTFSVEDINPLIYADASRAGFEAEEEVPVTDLLYGLILPSGADAAVALANMIAGSENEFAALMNEKCREIGLMNTHFANPTGLHDDAQYTTCTEMAMIMAYAMQNELCAKVLSTYQYTTTSTPQNPDGLLLTSTMFSRMYGNEVENVSILAGKTGYTIPAGNCMVSYAVKDDHPYVCVTALSTNKWHCIFDAFKIYENYLP